MLPIESLTGKKLMDIIQKIMKLILLFVFIILSSLSPRTIPASDRSLDTEGVEWFFTIGVPW